MESSQKSGAAERSRSSFTRARLVVTSKVLLDVFEGPLYRFEALAEIFHRAKRLQAAWTRFCDYRFDRRKDALDPPLTQRVITGVLEPGSEPVLNFQLKSSETVFQCRRLQCSGKIIRDVQGHSLSVEVPRRYAPRSLYSFSRSSVDRFDLYDRPVPLICNPHRAAEDGYGLRLITNFENVASPHGSVRIDRYE